MKRNLLMNIVSMLAAVLGITSFNANANPTDAIETIPDGYEYRELFTEGKSWIMWHGHNLSPNPETHLIFKVAVDGEQVIDGIDCKRLKVEIDKSHMQGFCMECTYFLGVDTEEGFAPALPEYIYAYEKDKKIYVYRESGPYYEYDENGYLTDMKYGKPYFDLLMDLDVNLGEKAMGMGEIKKVEYKEYGGILRRVIYNEDSYLGTYYPTHWIEGIGSNYCADEWEWYISPTIPVPTKLSNWYHNFLVSCSENGKIIYDNTDILKTEGINLDFVSSVETLGVNQEDDKYYNLQGIPIINPVKGNIYIHGGKKIKFQ